ncbi:hypothetical protein F4779DRAFT_251962 [Xylariaceae sp. FL0662B]|nr:hypothetical protein F4779DRAFT_251962 [Xylariaceae sp. FL0662B]
MKFSSATITPFLLALCSASPKDQWQIQRLTASSEPHGFVTHFAFDVVTSPGAGHTTCSGTGQSYQVLGNLPRTHCANSSVDFSWEALEGGGAKLTVWRQGPNGSWSHATRDIAADQISWTNEQSPTGRIQAYSGPQDFALDESETGE